MDAFNSDITEEEDEAVHSDGWYNTKDKGLKDESKQQNCYLEPLPEHEQLLHVDSLVHLGSNQIQTDTGRETETGRESCFSSPSVADQLTTKQRLAIWLTKTSTQSIPNTKFKKDSSNSQLSKFLSLKKLMKKKDCTGSLVDHSISKPHEAARQSKLKKCATVLAITPDRELRIEQNHESCGKAFQTFQQISNRGSEIFLKGLAYQNTAPGDLLDMHHVRVSNQDFPGLRPVNRLRSTSSNIQCSRCSVSSVTSNKESSQMSLLLDKRRVRMVQPDQECCICLSNCSADEMMNLEECNCSFCKECLKQYVSLEIMGGVYDISCPDPSCPALGVLSQEDMESLTDQELMDKHKSFCVNTEVSLDPTRTWCPSPGCHTICYISHGSKYHGVAVTCPACTNTFCSSCSASWHMGLSCMEAGKGNVMEGNFPWEDFEEKIKKCPQCQVMIEKNEGCAQMMCRSCKHVFCWFCLAGLDGDFMLRHYDSGSCRGKLGHSRSSVIIHRAQVLGFFVAFGLLLLAASPLILIAAPAILCCKCRSCMKTMQRKQEESRAELAAFKS